VISFQGLAVDTLVLGPITPSPCFEHRPRVANRADHRLLLRPEQARSAPLPLDREHDPDATRGSGRSITYSAGPKPA
jgi:hypothetical protein